MGGLAGMAASGQTKPLAMLSPAAAIIGGMGKKKSKGDQRYGGGPNTDGSMSYSGGA